MNIAEQAGTNDPVPSGVMEDVGLPVGGSADKRGRWAKSSCGVLVRIVTNWYQQ